MLDLFFLPIVIAFLWPTTNIKDTKNGEILTGAIPTLLFSFNAFINPLLYAFRVEKFQQAIKIRFDTITTYTYSGLKSYEERLVFYHSF